jgi:hypothetical protein
MHSTQCTLRLNSIDKGKRGAAGRGEGSARLRRQTRKEEAGAAMQGGARPARGAAPPS